MNDTPATTPDLIPEADLAERLGIPPATLRAWRKEGLLEEPTHYQRQGNRILLTPEGTAFVIDKANLEPDSLSPEDDTPPGPTVRLKVARNQGQNPRLLRCLLLEPREDIGPKVAVRLITPRVAVRHFKAGTEIDVHPTETADIFEYHGPKPRQTRI